MVTRMCLPLIFPNHLTFYTNTIAFKHGRMYHRLASLKKSCFACKAWLRNKWPFCLTQRRHLTFLEPEQLPSLTNRQWQMHLIRVLGFEWNHASEALSRGLAARTHRAGARVTTESSACCGNDHTHGQRYFNKCMLLCNPSFSLLHFLLNRTDLACTLSVNGNHTAGLVASYLTLSHAAAHFPC